MSNQTDYYEMPPAVAEMPLSAGAIVAGSRAHILCILWLRKSSKYLRGDQECKQSDTKGFSNLNRDYNCNLYSCCLVCYQSRRVERTVIVRSTACITAERAFGKTGVTALSTIALFATSNTVLMMMISGSRIIFGMAKGGALPRMLSRVHPETKTPWIAVIATMLVTIAVILLSRANLLLVANVSVFSILIVYALVNFVLIWLRYKRPELERPFRSPMKIDKFPVLAGLGLATSLVMLSQFSYGTILAGFVAIASGYIAHRAIEKYGKHIESSSESQQDVTDKK